MDGPFKGQLISECLFEKIVWTKTHCFVSSNSFHGQIIQKAVHQLSDPENKKNSHWIFLEQTTLKPCGFWVGEALEAQAWPCLNITLAQKWHSATFQISAEKKFPSLIKRLLHMSGLLGPLLLKCCRVWWWLVPKLFKDYIFCFQGNSFGC